MNRTKPHFTGTFYMTHREYIGWLIQCAGRWSALGDKEQCEKVTMQASLLEKMGEEKCDVCMLFKGSQI